MMAAISAAAVAKKIAAALVSDEKGRKFIWYAIGITIFILMIPVIVVFCLFGWIADAEVDISERMDYTGIISSANEESEFDEQIRAMDDYLNSFECSTADKNMTQIGKNISGED